MGMDIQLRTELENLIRRDVEGGPYRSVEHALSLLHAQESWVGDDRAENNTRRVDVFAPKRVDPS
jgi:hypothetical protein